MKGSKMKSKNPSLDTVGVDTVRRGAAILEGYRKARYSLEKRILSDEDFWCSRHRPSGVSKGSDMPYPASGWLFSTVVNKHADIMESIPSPVCIAREKSDVEYAEVLNSVLPVILDRLSFNRLYSELQYDKLKHGTAVYGVFWNPDSQNGLGDIDVKRIDLLNLFWEPGVCSIQDSQNVFYTSLIDNETLYSLYPWARESGSSVSTCAADYVFDPSIDTSDKSLVVDWYYKKQTPHGVILHYVKFVGETVLYASENDPSAVSGFYGHGLYPFVLDTLYRENGTPCGYGLISVTRGTQEYIDRLDRSILEHAVMSAKPRYMMKKNVGMNLGDFLDWSKPVVEVDGDLTEERVKAITLPALDQNVITVRDSKINEIKEISATHNYNYGYASQSISSGVAIAALQEAGSKVMRDIITSSFDAFSSVIKLIIELIRQFYDEERCFRITKPNRTGYEYIEFSGKDIKEKSTSLGDELLYRLPEFDVEVRTLKSSAFSRYAQNETVSELFKMGLFSPEKKNEALIVLDALELEGKGRIIEMVRELKSEKREEQPVPDAKTPNTDKKLAEGIRSAIKLKTKNKG